MNLRLTAEFKDILKTIIKEFKNVLADSSATGSITVEFFVWKFFEFYFNEKTPNVPRPFLDYPRIDKWVKVLSAEEKLKILEYLEDRAIDSLDDSCEREDFKDGIENYTLDEGVTFREDGLFELLKAAERLGESDFVGIPEFLDAVLLYNETADLVPFCREIRDEFNEESLKKLKAFLYSDEEDLDDSPEQEGETKSFGDLINDIKRLFEGARQTPFSSPFGPGAGPQAPFDIKSILGEDSDFDLFSGQDKSVTSKPKNESSKYPTLDQFAYNMVKAAKEGKYDPVIGRDDLVNSIMEDMCKRKKPNVVLLGEAGTGKTSLVELLAQKIASGNVPEPLKDKVIFNLNLNDLVAGTKYRGEYEQRLQEVIREVIQHPEVIVYIDEFHNLVGNGGEKGNGDGANILKPYLARGEFRCIGATTLAEYRKFIEKDAALKRRFTEIIIEEPTADETYNILKAIASKYETFHGIRVSTATLRLCVDLADRYISDRYFPDKAIDILDKAMAIAKISKVKDTTIQDQLLGQLDEIIDKKVDAVQGKGDFVEGERLRQEELALSKQLEKELKRQEAAEKNKKNWPEITEEVVMTAVSKLSKVPVDKISKTDNEMLSEMRNVLQKNVIGQDSAIDTVVKAIQRNYLGLRDPNRPILSALFIGPSGVGKTYLCRKVAEIFYGSEKSLIRIDMNNFKSEMDVTRLIGASAGYVGYDDEPILMQVKRKPRCIVLLDEIEKAHPSIYDIFMDILDEGQCTLSDGTRVDFTNAIIIFTGNIGTRELKENGKGIGFESNLVQDRAKRNHSIVMKAVEKTFRPEFINRIGTTVVFNELGNKELGKIFDIELADLRKKLGKKYKIQVTKPMKDYIISLCNPVYGARDLKRFIEQYIVDPVSSRMLEEPSMTKFSVSVGQDKEAVVQ